MTDTATQPLPSEPGTLADGRYRLRERLGAGGMGLVVRATDDVLHRDVAVKLLADHLAADPDARERFQREARAAARITDPHVVAVFDVGEEQGRPYLVMELVEGPSLADTLAADGPLAPPEVVDVAADALAGISRAHTAGLLHRDVKPGNLLRAPDGTVKVADFGVAEAAEAPGLTRTGLVIGTRSYLAPERVAGQPATVRTDLYALGATLLELLTGRPPAGVEVTGPLDDAPGLPAPLSELLERLLEHDPQQRPASAEAALAVLAGEVPTEAVGSTSGGHTRLLPTGQPPDEPAATAPSSPVAHASGSSRDDTPKDTPAHAPSPPASGDPTRSTEDASPPADDTSPPAHDATRPGDDPVASGPPMSWRRLATLAVLLLLVAVAFQIAGGGETDPVDRAGVERDSDPADTARNLGEWLRGQAER